MQRLTEFRSKIGSAGLAIVNSLLDSEDGKDLDPDEERMFDTDEKRQQYCSELLIDEQYAYADYQSAKVSILLSSFTSCSLLIALLLLQKKNGCFASPLILRTLAVYYSSIEGAMKVRGLGNLVNSHPYGAIGLCTASVRRLSSLPS